MLLITPDVWVDGQAKPVTLLSGERAVHVWRDATVFAMQRAGVQLAVLTRRDYVRFMKLYPGPDGLPTHEIPTSMDVADLTMNVDQTTQAWMPTA